MDNQKAIEYFYRVMELGNIRNDAEQEVYELAIQALEKQIPKESKTRFTGGGYCPNCNIKLWGKSEYCGKCGQKLNWKEVE